MLIKAHFPGKYIQGAGAIAELPDLLKKGDSPALMLASPTALRKVLPRSGIAADDPSVRVEPFGGECSEAELTRIAGRIRECRAGVIVGMGGGKTIDAAKIAADRAGLPVVIVPTIASTDAPCSGCAVVYTEDGVFAGVCTQRNHPAVVLVDSQIIIEAPVRFLVAGMGDALATWFEARSCHASRSPNECGGANSIAGMGIAKLCYDTLLEFGPAALADARVGKISPAVEAIIEANTLLSSIGFECGGLASAHAIHNGLTALPQTHSFYHGEKVAFGLLAGLCLSNAPEPELSTVYQFCQSVGLPTTLAAIGLADVSDDDLAKAAARACAPDERIHHEPVPVNTHAVLHAMLRADAIGRDGVTAVTGSNAKMH